MEQKEQQQQQQQQQQQAPPPPQQQQSQPQPQAQPRAPPQTQPSGQIEQAQQGNVMPMMHPNNGGMDQTAMGNGVNGGGFGINSFDPNAMNQMGEHNFLTPEALDAMMRDQPLLPDTSLGGMPMGGDPSLMMPFPMANGQGTDPNGPHKAPKGVTAEEIALYDRQIRLWGMKAQEKIQNANVLLITIKALANEVAKNLVLAGVGSLTILDDAVVTETDLGAQFFLQEEGNIIGQNRAQAAAPAIQKLNPRVKVHVDAGGIKSKGPSYFQGFDVVVATDLDPDTFNLVNTATRLNDKPFYAAGTHGMYGFIFSDLIEHTFAVESEVSNVNTNVGQETRTRSVVNVKLSDDGPKKMQTVTRQELYSTWLLASDGATLPEEYRRSNRRLRAVNPALSGLRALWEFMQIKGGLPSSREDLQLFTQIATRKHKALSLPPETLKSDFLRSFLQNLGAEIAPVTAILGGQLSQDVINVLGQTQQPIQNMVIFDGTTMEASVYALHPEGILGRAQLSLGGNEGMGNGGDMMMGGMGGMGGMPPIGFDPSGMPAPDGFMMGGMPQGQPGAMPGQAQVQQPPQQPPQQPQQSQPPQQPQQPPQDTAAPRPPQQQSQPQAAEPKAPAVKTEAPRTEDAGKKEVKDEKGQQS